MQFSLYSSPVVNTPAQVAQTTQVCMHNHVPAHVTAPPPPLPRPFQLLFQTYDRKKKQTRPRPLRRAKSGCKTSGKTAAAPTISGKIVDILHPPHGLSGKGGSAPTRWARGLPLPVGSDQPERFLNYCVILDSVVSCRAIYRAGAVLRGNVDGLELGSARKPRLGPLQNEFRRGCAGASAAPKGVRQRRTIF